MRYIDSHAHLGDPAFDDDRDGVIARARDAGAEAIVSIGESSAAADRAAALADAHPGLIYHTAGVHPHDAARFDPVADVAAIRRHAAAGAVAVGECGLDYHYDHAPRAAQRVAFATQLVLAAELALPVVVHSRDADADIAAMIEEAGRDGVRGVLHCFTGPRHLADVALGVGWYVSFSGIVTFRKWDDEALLRAVPDDRLLVESDAPYLAPVPFRGKRNEPGFVPRTIERLAAARSTSPEALAEQAMANARALFALAMPELGS